VAYGYRVALSLELRPAEHNNVLEEGDENLWDDVQVDEDYVTDVSYFYARKIFNFLNAILGRELSWFANKNNRSQQRFMEPVRVPNRPRRPPSGTHESTLDQRVLDQLSGCSITTSSTVSNQRRSIYNLEC